MMQLQERINNFHQELKFPRSLFVGGDGRISGTWIMGNDYRVKSEYYGGYPAGYLKRIAALFPDRRKVLHLFSGKVNVSDFPGDTLDINPELNPTYCVDAHNLYNIPLAQYDLILADPPYSIEDAERYKTSMIKRNIIIEQLAQQLRPNSYVVWLDQVLPMYRKTDWDVDGVIGMVKSTNHRFRVIVIYRKL